MIDLPLRTLAEYDQPYEAPVNAAAGPEGTVIITYDEHVEVFANLASSTIAAPEPVAIFNRDPPAQKKKNKTISALPFKRFTHKVIFHEESNRFVGITDGANITSWPATHGSTLYDSVSVPVYATTPNSKNSSVSVHSIHTSHKLPKHVVVVDSNGTPSMQLVPTTANTHANTPLPAADKDITLLHASLIHVKESGNPAIPRLLTVTYNSATRTAHLNTYTFAGPVGSTNTVNPSYSSISLSLALELPAPAQDNAPLVAANVELVYAPVTAYSIALFWSNGYWQVYSVSATASVSTSSSSTALTVVQSKQLSSPFHTTSLATSLSFLSPQHVLLTVPVSNTQDAQMLVSTPLAASSVLYLVLETVYATVTGFNTFPDPQPAANKTGSVRIVPLEVDSFSAPALILTPTHLYMFQHELTRSSLLQVMGQAHKSTPFFATAHKTIKAVSSVAPGAAAAQLMTTPAPFTPHLASTSLAQVVQPHGTHSQAFVSSLIHSWNGVSTDSDFCSHVHSHWASFANTADSTERRVLSRMFPTLNTMLRAEATASAAEEEPAKPAKKSKTASGKAKAKTVEEEADPFDFVCSFFAHTSTDNNVGEESTLSETDITNLASNALAWGNLAKSALMYTGQAAEVSSVAAVDAANQKLRRTMQKDNDAVTSVAAAEEEARRIRFAQPLSPLFIALTARYCLHQLQQMLADNANDARILYLLPLRVLLCSQSLSARLVPGLIGVLMRLRQWALVQEAITVLPDLSEAELVGMLQSTIDGWADSIDPDTTKKAKEQEKTNGKRKAAAADATASLCASLVGQPMTAAYAKLLVLSVLKTKVSPRFLETELKALSITHVFILLRYLLAWVQAIYLCGTLPATVKTKLFMSVKERQRTAELLNKARVAKGQQPLPLNQALRQVYAELKKARETKNKLTVQGLFGEMSVVRKRALKGLSEEEMDAKIEEMIANTTFEKGMDGTQIRDSVKFKNFMFSNIDLFTGISPVALLSPASVSRLHMDTALSWISAILDAHFAQMLLLINTANAGPGSQGAESYELLTMLREVVGLCSQTATQCQHLMPFLKYWNKQLNGNQNVPIPAVSNYSIQLMKL